MSRAWAAALSALLACGGEAPPPAVTAPEPAAPAPLFEEGEAWRYVGASRLNVRAGPSEGSARVGAVALNQPLKRLQVEGDFTEVELLNGERGWVASAFLSEERLRWEQAVEAARAAGDPASALPHWQRAAALKPLERGTMSQLAAAYEAAGDPSAAAKVQASLARPEALHVPLSAEPGVVELPWAYVPVTRETPAWLTGAVDAHLGGTYLEPAALRGLGLSPPEAAQWWVLPAEGAAAPAEALGAGATIGNECDATLWLVTRLRHGLPEGTPVVAAWAGEPPESWRVDAGAEARPSEEEAMARAKAAAEAVPERAGWRSWPSGAAREVRADWRAGPPSEGESDSERWATQRFTVSAAGVEVHPAGAYAIEWSAESLSGGPQTRRDIDGDGQPDSAGADGCQAWISGDLWSARTETRCCGC